MVKLLALSTLLMLPLAANAADPLRSPWDGKDVKLTDASYACPAIVHLSPDLTTDRFYSDSKSSIIDPGEMEGVCRDLRTIQGTGTADRRCRGCISHDGQPRGGGMRLTAHGCRGERWRVSRERCHRTRPTTCRDG